MGDFIDIASVTPMTSAETNPLYGDTYRHFFAGSLQPCENVVVRLQPIDVAADRRVACFNLGSRVFRLPGAWTLVPLLVVMAAPWLALRRPPNAGEKEGAVFRS